MGIFSGLEGSLEKHIEGFFKDKFKSKVQPAAIAKKLTREMRDRRRTGVNKIYAPNSFTVFLSDPDYDGILSIIGSLAKELQDYVSQKAEEKRYTLTGAPLVEFVREAGEETGFIHIVSGFSEDLPDPVPPVAEGKTLEKTQTFTLTSEMAAINRSFRPILEIAAGPERGRVVQISKPYAVLGRHSGCDVLIRDSSISRRQAGLAREGGRVIIEDLDSANGTLVNGVPIGKKVLAPGDEITLGTTVCIFKVD